MNVDESIERTTGHVLWAYALLFAAVAIHASPEGRTWLGIAWFVGFTTVYFTLTRAASKRSNPLGRVLS